MAGSYYLYNGDGSQKIFTTPPYLSQAHIKVYIDRVEYVDFSWLNDSQIELLVPPSVGTRVVVARETPRTRLMNYTPNSILKSAVMNKDSLQMYYIMEEVIDATGDTLSTDIISNQWDAGTLRIQRVGNPVDSADAATKSYVDNEVAAAVAGTVDHGYLSGLGDDDHPQYLNVARGDTRYTPISHTNVYDHANLHSHSNKALLDLIPSHPSADRLLKAKVDGAVVWEVEPAGVPSGAVMAFAMSAAPSGWLKCNGAAISRTTYAALFAAIGTTFGAGDGSTTFNLPDLRGEFVRGWDDGRGADAGRTLGSAQASANLSHSHGVNDPSHRHTTNYSGYNPGSTPANQVMTSVGSYLFNVNSVSEFSVTGISIAANGASEARPRNVALLYCVKY